MKLVYGFGINDCKYPIRDKAPECWRNMVQRCYDTRLLSSVKYQRYVGCTVSDEWRVSSDFCEWAFSQKGFYHPNSCLDKDILNFGNKVYCPEHCSFVPREINIALTFSDAKRGKYPLGVGVKESSKGVVSFIARLNRGALGPLSKTFNTVEDAVRFYRAEKVKHLSYLADKYSEWLSSDVYETLKDYNLQAQ